MHGYRYSCHIPLEHQCLPGLKICVLCWPLCSAAAPGVLLLAAGLTPQVSTTLNSLHSSSGLKTSIEAAVSHYLLTNCATRCTTSFPWRCLYFWQPCEIFVDITSRIFSTASSHPCSLASANMELTDSFKFDVSIPISEVADDFHPSTTFHATFRYSYPIRTDPRLRWIFLACGSMSINSMFDCRK